MSNLVKKKTNKPYRLDIGQTWGCTMTMWIPDNPAYEKAPKLMVTFHQKRQTLTWAFANIYEFLETIEQMRAIAEENVEIIDELLRLAHLEHYETKGAINEGRLRARKKMSAKSLKIIHNE